MRFVKDNVYPNINQTNFEDALKSFRGNSDGTVTVRIPAGITTTEMQKRQYVAEVRFIVRFCVK